MDDDYTLEPDDIDKDGNRYVYYEEYELAQSVLVDVPVVEGNVSF